MSSPPKKKNDSGKTPVVIEGTAVEVKPAGATTVAAPAAPAAPTTPAEPEQASAEATPEIDTGLEQIFDTAHCNLLLAKLHEAAGANRPAHRPSGYNEEIVEIFCAEIATGKLINQVCELDDMPSERTISRWQLKYPEFREKVSAALRTSIDNLPQHALAASRGRGEGEAKKDITWARFQVETDFAVYDRNERTIAERAAREAAAAAAAGGPMIPGDDARVVESRPEVVEHNPFRAAIEAWGKATGNDAPIPEPVADKAPAA
jgi:hypothetical protein